MLERLRVRFLEISWLLISSSLKFVRCWDKRSPTTGVRKGGRGALSHGFGKSQQNGCFLDFEWEKPNFTTFVPPWKKSFRRCPQHVLLN